MFATPEELARQAALRWELIQEAKAVCRSTADALAVFGSSREAAIKDLRALVEHLKQKA